MAKTTLGLFVVPQGNSWTKLCTGAHYIQNVDNEPVYFVFGDNAPADSVGTKECHVFKQELDDNYVNDAGDTIWVKQQPHKASKLILTQL